MNNRSPSRPPRPLSPAQQRRGAPQRRERRGRLAGRVVVVCVTGSVAAYKAVILVRLLLKEGADVEVVLSKAGEQFVGRATFAGITGKPVHSDMFAADLGGELHVDLAAAAELLIIAPATADVLARLCQGRADSAVTASALAATCPVLVAPAMHPNMWSHPATQRNIATLEADGRLQFIGPSHGEVASGESGLGRLAEPEDILAAAVQLLTPGDLSGRHIVITAGPTVEDLDPVRFISNRSSGKMGFALADRAAARGARVTLISGPVSLATPHSVQRIDVRSAVAMRGAVWQALGPDLSHTDGLIMCAAVGDYRPAETHASKLKRGSNRVSLELVQNPDILAEVGSARHGKQPVLVGFAVETDSDERVVQYARDKLHKKGVDLVVANHAQDAFEKDDNRATLVSGERAEPLPRLPKPELADRVLDWLAQRLAESR